MLIHFFSIEFLSLLPLFHRVVAVLFHYFYYHYYLIFYEYFACVCVCVCYKYVLQLLSWLKRCPLYLCSCRAINASFSNSKIVLAVSQFHSFAISVKKRHTLGTPSPWTPWNRFTVSPVVMPNRLSWLMIMIFNFSSLHRNTIRRISTRRKSRASARPKIASSPSA